jgi:hypothetical protein
MLSVILFSITALLSVVSVASPQNLSELEDT